MYFSSERVTRISRALYTHIREGTTDMLDSNFVYDLSMYASPEVAEQEREKIFNALPIMAAHSSQIAEPGSYITVQMNGSNVILVRQKDGGVTALLNECRHRGAMVASHASGTTRNFTCPYHGWVYSSEGKNKLISYDKSFGKSACSDFDLVRLPAEERHGFIWVIENPLGVIDVKTFLGPGMDELLEEYGLEKWHFYKEEVFEFPQNWKVMFDGLIDGYHVEFLHGDTISPYFKNNTMSSEVYGDHAMQATPRTAIVEYMDSGGDDHDKLEQFMVMGTVITPNSQITMHPHHIEYWTMYQDSVNPANSRVHLRYLTPESSHDEESVQRLDKNWKIATSAIVNEDVPTGNTVQKNASGRFSGKVTLGRNEILNQVFHRAYHQLMEAD